MHSLSSEWRECVNKTTTGIPSPVFSLWKTSLLEFLLSREEERNSAELSELQHLHQVMNGIGVTVIHGNHPKLPDVCLMCERDSPETTVSIWEENPIQEPNVLTIEAVCINGKEEKDEILLELTRLQRELMDVEKENERILTSLEEL